MMKTLLSILLLFFWTVILPAQTPEAPQTPLTEERAIAMFLERNVEIQAARHHIDRAKAEQIAARFRPNPTVMVTVENFGVSGPTPARQLYEVAATYTEIIERGGKRRLRGEVADLEVSVAEAAFEDVLRLKLFELRRAFLEALLAHHRVEIATGNRTLVEELLRLTAARFEHGAIPEADLLKVRLEKARADSALRQAQLEESHAMIELLEKLEEPDLGVRPISGTLDTPLMTVTLPALRELALNNRPDLRASAAQIALGEHQLSLERARATTDLAPFVGYRRVGQNNTLTFGVTFTVPTKNRNEGGIARAAADHRIAEGAREVTHNHVMVDVETAFRTYEAAGEQLALYRDQLIHQADEAQAIAQAAYEEGATELLPVLEAQRTRAEVQKDYIQKQFDYRASLLGLELAVGRGIRP